MIVMEDSNCRNRLTAGIRGCDTALIPAGWGIAPRIRLYFRPYGKDPLDVPVLPLRLVYNRLPHPVKADDGLNCQRRSDFAPARRRNIVPLARRQLVPVVHGRAPRAGRRSLRAAGVGPRVGGACGPTGSSGERDYSEGVLRPERLCLSR